MYSLSQPLPRPITIRSLRHLAVNQRRHSDWTYGLATRTANALRAFGLHSRAEVEALPPRRLKCIPNLGRASLQDLQQWLQGSASGLCG